MAARMALARPCAGRPALVATELMGLAVGRPDEGGAPLRFMTCNIKVYLARKTPDGYARIAWEIARHDPAACRETNFSDSDGAVHPTVDGRGKATHAVIVAGDLDAGERSPVVRQLLANGLRDACSGAAVGYGYTIGHDLLVGP